MWNQVGVYDGFVTKTLPKNINERKREKERGDLPVQGRRAASIDSCEVEPESKAGHEDTEQG